MRVDIVKQQKIHRGDSSQFLMNFLSNLSHYARLVRIAMPVAKEKPDIFETAKKSYIIGIAACLETFFRDLYLHTLERNPDLLETALEQIKEKESLISLFRTTSAGVSFAEFAMSHASFRSPEEIERHYSTFFTPRGFLDSLDGFELSCAIPARRSPGLARLKLADGWRKNLANVFSLRHEFAHDANSKRKIDTKEMRSIETTCVLLPQITSYLEPFLPPSPKSMWVAQSKTMAPSPVILLINDLVSEWVVHKSPPALKYGIEPG